MFYSSKVERLPLEERTEVRILLEQLNNSSMEDKDFELIMKSIDETIVVVEKCINNIKSTDTQEPFFQFLT